MCLYVIVVLRMDESCSCRDTQECLALSTANGTRTDNFVVDIEQFSFLVQHTVTSSDIGLHRELNEMKGELDF